MTCNIVNSVGDHSVPANPGPANTSHIQSAEKTAGCFNCWLEKTSCVHHAVIAHASALMRAHRRVTKVDGALNRQAH
jgi:hypothetical protein